METQTRNPRPAMLAGQWYPGDPETLAQNVDAYVESAGIAPSPGEIVGVIAPHAGHRYSGPVAGHAFAALAGRQPEVVAVLSPMHQPYQQPLLTSAHDAYLTPLGTVPVAREAIAALDAGLTADLGFGLAPIARDGEHAIEIELPFLQRVLSSEFELLPVMIRDQTAAVTRCLGKHLANTLAEKEALLVASSDLSHFYSQQEAKILDGEVMRRIEAFDPLGVLQAETEGVGFACGRAAVAAVLWAARQLGATRVQALHYATSGDVTGDYDSVVGYGAAVIYK